MQNFKKFYFKSYKFHKKSLKASFFYSFDNKINFKEIIDFKSKGFNTVEIDQYIINVLLFHLHIALGVSYYKIYPTCYLVVESGYLNPKQVIFWKNFYINGLGEFLYKNKISVRGLFNFLNKYSETPKNGIFSSLDVNMYEKISYSGNKKFLVPVGGGKDSIVSIELLKQSGILFDTVVFGKLDKIKENTIKISGKNNILIKRELSKNLFYLNTKGYYNGHIPITGIIAFVLSIVAYLYDYKYIVLSNEKSSNYPNIIWEGININHQYSKSLDFEKDFNSYIQDCVPYEIKYFSLLRGFYELKIAELFSVLGKKYFLNFSSCNKNFKVLKNNIKKEMYWCSNCSKCAFVFCILGAFLGRKELTNIFGENLYEKRELENLFRELLGISGHKPFECVGIPEEVILAMHMHYKNLRKNEISFIMKMFESEVYNKLENDYIKNLEKKILSYNDENIIPNEVKKELRKVWKSLFQSSFKQGVLPIS